MSADLLCRNAAMDLGCCSVHNVLVWCVVLVDHYLQGGCGISVLPVEVLSNVLQHVDLSDRLLSCSLVCSLWRKAAAMSVTDIHVPKCKRGQAASLSVWLRAHAAQARLASISISMANNRLFLPLQHLASLRTLRLDNARVMAADTAEAVAGPQSDRQEFLTPALSGLTRLELLSCKVSRGGQACACLQLLSHAQELNTWKAFVELQLIHSVLSQT